MESSPTRVLVVANQTALTDALQAAVRERARRSPCDFTLLVPVPATGLHRLIDPEDVSDAGAHAVLEEALPLLALAAGAPVTGRVGDPEPLAAIQDALNLVGFDEVILSTLPHRLSRWLHLDLPRKVAALGIPVTTVTAPSSGRAPVPAPA